METTLSKIKKNDARVHLSSIVQDYSKQHNLLPNHGTIVLGFSGGPDSVFLLHVLAEWKRSGKIQEVIVAHLDHGWRPDSSKDVDFCKQVAAHYGVLFVSDHLDHFKNNIPWNGSKEDLGRKARRLFFKKVMQDYHADAIALAHHRDDQLETFFIRLIRGTSLTGLCAMRAKNGPYIRPLLSISKQDIVAYLQKHHIPFLTDPSNSSPDYLRNRIRMTVLPALRACDERFDSNSAKTIERLQEAEDYLVDVTKKLFDSMSTQEDTITVDQFLAQPPFMQYRLLMHWLIALRIPFPTTKNFLQDIIRFFKAKKSKTHQFLQGWVMEKEKNSVKIVKK